MTEFFDALSKKWPKEVNYLIENLHGMIGGSTLINEEAANDIDVVVNEFAYQYNRDAQVQLQMMGFYSIAEGGDDYEDIDRIRLVEILELPAAEGRKKINVIIVGAMYWPAYMGACACMSLEPERYQTREERIKLHVDFCQQARSTAEGNYLG